MASASSPSTAAAVFEAYKDFDGIRFGAHFTPQFEKERRARQFMASLRRRRHRAD